jgi:hypothetical protein
LKEVVVVEFNHYPEISVRETEENEVEAQFDSSRGSNGSPPEYKHEVVPLCFLTAEIRRMRSE